MDNLQRRAHWYRVGATLTILVAGVLALVCFAWLCLVVLLEVTQ